VTQFVEISERNARLRRAKRAPRPWTSSISRSAKAMFRRRGRARRAAGQVDPDESSSPGCSFRKEAASSVGGQKVVGPLKIAGMAFQAPTCCPGAATLENILLPLEIVQAPPQAPAVGARGPTVAKVEALLAQVRPRRHGQQIPLELSGGMQQRASLWPGTDSTSRGSSCWTSPSAPSTASHARSCGA